MTNLDPVGIILAAGKGTRMKSDLPKGLHRVVGIPMVEHVARAMRAAGIQRIIVVVGHGGELLQEALGPNYEYAWQREQLGTGHATLMTRDLLKGHQGPVIVAPGDVPLLDKEAFEVLLSAHHGAECTLASTELHDPKGYGRIVRDANGMPCRIVEEKDARGDQKLIKEVNAAVYCFNAETLLRLLPGLKNDNAQGEYYLTDLVETIYSTSKKVNAVVFQDPAILAGVNDRWQLAQSEQEMRLRIVRRHAMAGVTFSDPASTLIGPDVEIDVDAWIEAGTQVLGNSRIGARSRLGPYSRLDSCVVGSDSWLYFTHATNATVENGVKCGPYANLRPGTVLKDGVKIGNFVEVKNSILEEESAASHLAYIGDSQIGERTNIGAGTITCNYDGVSKHRTVIGKDTFVGSNSTLVAPIEIGDSVIVAAGSTITAHVPDGAGAFGRARQETKEGWAARWKEKTSSRK